MGDSGPLRGLAGWHEFCRAGSRKGRWPRSRRTGVRIYAGRRSRAKGPDTAGIRGSGGALPLARSSASARSARRPVSGAGHSGREIRGAAARSHARCPHYSDRQQQTSAKLLGVGRGFPRPLGRRHAGGRREQLQRADWLDMAGNFVDENEHVLERFSSPIPTRFCTKPASATRQCS